MMSEVRSSVLEAVRAARAAGLLYDDEVIAYVAEAISEEPTRTLWSECHRAKGRLKDEANAAKIEALKGDGYHLAEALHDGERLTIMRPTTYAGQSVPDYSAPIPVRVQTFNGQTVLIPKGRRTHGYSPSRQMLVKEGW